MNKYKINLQAFAEDGAGESNSNPQQQNTNTNIDEGNNNKPQLKYSDADVDKIISKKFAEWTKKKESEITEAKRLAQMSESEKAEHERNKMQKQLNELLAEKSRSEMTKTARNILREKGINASEDLLSVLINSDADKTKKAIDSFAKLFEVELKKQVKESLKSPTPRRMTSSANITKDEIMKIKDRKERQRLINENIGLFTGDK